jgi:hypothetical protein
MTRMSKGIATIAPLAARHIQPGLFEPDRSCGVRSGCRLMNSSGSRIRRGERTECEDQLWPAVSAQASPGPISEPPACASLGPLRWQGDQVF